MVIKFRFTAVGQNRTGQNWVSFIFQSVCNKVAFGAMYQDKLNMESFGDANRCENIICAVSVDVKWYFPPENGKKRFAFC